MLSGGHSSRPPRPPGPTGLCLGPPYRDLRLQRCAGVGAGRRPGHWRAVALGVTVGPDDLGGLFQPEWFCDSSLAQGLGSFGQSPRAGYCHRVGGVLRDSCSNILTTLTQLISSLMHLFAEQLEHQLQQPWCCCPCCGRFGTGRCGARPSAQHDLGGCAVPPDPWTVPGAAPGQSPTFGSQPCVGGVLGRGDRRAHACAVRHWESGQAKPPSPNCV